MKTYLKQLFCLLLIFATACSLFDDESERANLNVDYLLGTDESGRIKRQLNFTDNEDETVNSDIVFEYEGDNLVRKTYNDYIGNSSYVLKREDFIYSGNVLTQMIQYFRNTSDGPLKVSINYYYSYPEENTKIETIYLEDGELRDSVIYRYSGNFLVEERHFNHLGEWGRLFQYNNEGKLWKATDIEDDNETINYFDEKGLLERTVSFSDGEETGIVHYEQELNSKELIIYAWMDGAEYPTSHKVFRNGRLVEYVLYHPTFPGSQWYCNRFEYY